MKLRNIALLNLRRRKGKAAFLLAGLVIGVSTVVAMISLVTAMAHDIDHKLELYGANILVTPKTETLSLAYGGLSLGGVSFGMEEIRQEDLAKIGSIRNAGNVAAVGPVVLGLAKAGEKRVLLAGIDPTATGILKPWWKFAGALPGTGEVFAGAQAANLLNLSTGSWLVLNGRKLRVSGILEATGSQDDQLLFTDLKTAQEMFNKRGLVSMVEIAALCKDCPIDDMVRQLGAALPGASVMAIQQVVKGRLQAIEQLKKFSLGFSAVVLLVGSLMVLVSMMGSVRERTAEIGVFRALGFRKSHIMRIIYTEALTVSVIAGVIGYPLGFMATRLILPIFTEGHAINLSFDPKLAAGALLLSIVVGLVSSTYPAIAAANMDPNEALRAL